ncbi:MAG: type II toxin-antitoxin system VapC family toxin [Vicinamibacterales bacterium]
MRSTLVDSNVLIDLFDEGSEWREWSDAMISMCGSRGALVINPIVYAEVSAGFDDIDDVDEALPREYLRREALPWEAAFVAGHAFVRYRRLGGRRPSPLPDFYIGAHAAVAGYTLLTRDPRRYRYYFPRLRILSP